MFKGGRKRKAPVSDSQQAIDNLKEMEELLVRKQLFLEEKVQNELVLAKKYGKSNQRQALAALRRKKIHELDLEKVDSMLMKLEGQRTALENAGHNVAVMKVLEYTNKVLKGANKNLDIDKVNDIMDEISEGLAVSDEVAAAISRPIDQVADEDELMSELMELEAEKKSEVPAVPVPLPKVPHSPLTRSKSRELSRKDSEMAELQQWAAAN